MTVGWVLGWLQKVAIFRGLTKEASTAPVKYKSVKALPSAAQLNIKDLYVVAMRLWGADRATYGAYADGRSRGWWWW